MQHFRWELVGAALLSLASCSCSTSEHERVASSVGALSTWVLGETLFGPRGAVSTSVSGDTLLLISKDGVATYRYRASSWTLQSGNAKLGDCGELNGLATTNYAAAISGDTALISGNRLSGHYGPCVYERSGDDFVQTQTLEAADAAEKLSQSYAISGDTILITASTGVAVYERQAGTFIRAQTLQTSDGSTEAKRFWIRGQRAVVLSGSSLYAFERGALGWSETEQVDAHGEPVNDAALTEQGLLAQSSTNTHIYVQESGHWVLDGVLPSRGLMDAGNDVAVVGSVVYERDHGAWYKTSDLNQSSSNFPLPPFVQPLTSVALWDGGVLLALNGDFTYDGLTFHELASVKSFECFPEPDTCSADSDCRSAHCVEGVCCQTECAGTCVSCLATRKGAGIDGVCGPVMVGTDPRDSCDADPAGSCGQTGLCAEDGACQPSSDGTPCAGGYVCMHGECATTCVDDAACDIAQQYSCAEGSCQPNAVVELGGAGGEPTLGVGGDSSAPAGGGGEPPTGNAGTATQLGGAGGAEPQQPSSGAGQTGKPARHAGGGGGCTLSPTPAGSFAWIALGGLLLGKLRRRRTRSKHSS